MKKFILSAMVLGFAGIASSHANTLNTTVEISASAQDSVKRTEVKLEDLPEAVKTTLASDPYKEWTPTAAFHVKSDKNEYYEINVKKEEETGSIKLTADGKPVEE